MQTYLNTLRWPVITWVVINVIFFGALAAVPDMAKAVSPAGITPLLLAVGLWAGYKVVDAGGNYGHAFVSGVVVGLVCAILDLLGDSLVFRMGMAEAFPGAVYFFGMNLFGALIGGGFRLTK